MERTTAIRWYTEHLTKAAEKSPQHLTEAKRWLARNDLFYLLVAVLHRNDVNRDWLFDRCREVQASPDGHLDLWAREHYKSTIITYGLTIKDILNDPNETFGIFSHTRPIAKGFLRQIKREFEANEDLRELFPDIFWDNPWREAPKWSEDDGIIVKRSGNPKEATIEAWGMVDGMPTSRHFGVLNYDDVVTERSVTASMTEKTTRAWELSQSLGKDGGKVRYVGTRYAFSDTYRVMIQRQSVKVRKYPATVDGRVDGEPVLFSREALAKKRRDMGSFTFGCQMMQDPKADTVMGFDRQDVRYWSAKNTPGLNLYIIVDPASKKGATNDYTSMQVIGLGSDENYYWVYGFRDRLSLTERADRLIDLHRIWKPIAVGYEEYGLQADVEHIEYRQAEENYRFDITRLGGPMAKNDRIGKLIPIVEAHRWYMPETCHVVTREGNSIDMVKVFLDEELEPFPVPVHDDMLDGSARILDPDLNAKFPKPKQRRPRVQVGAVKRKSVFARN